jgi:hypothetical protein
MSLNFDTLALNLVRAHQQLSNICTKGLRFTTCFCFSQSIRTSLHTLGSLGSSRRAWHQAVCAEAGLANGNRALTQVCKAGQGPGQHAACDGGDAGAGVVSDRLSGWEGNETGMVGRHGCI